MSGQETEKTTGAEKPRGWPTASVVLADGRLIELVYDPTAEITKLVVFERGAWTVSDDVELPSGRRHVPFSPWNNLIRNHVAALLSAPEEYGDEAQLTHLRRRQPRLTIPIERLLEP